jgi:hypothetical protein
LGPEVIQPERNTSATPAIVASSIVGRVIGKYGNPGFAAVAAEEAEAGMLMDNQRKEARMYTMFFTPCTQGYG